MPEFQLTAALGSIRISRFRDGDESTSPERHEQDLRGQPGVRYVKITRDLDVSATKFSPFDRPDLGPWLTDPKKIAQYDELIVWKLDRFCRSAKDMRDMLNWADKYGKKLVFQQDNLIYDPYASGVGKALNDAMISLVAAFAEMEALNTSTRTKNLHAYLRENHSWSGGQLPFGYEVTQVPVPDDKDKTRKILTPSKEPCMIIAEIADRLIDGESSNSISKDLNERGILSPADWSRKLQGKPTKGSSWSAQTLRTMFGADSMLGYFMQKDEKTRRRIPARDANGNPVRAWEPVISADRLREVRAALAANTIAKRPHVTWNVNPLLDVAKCFDCGSNLTRLTHRNGKTYLRCYKSTAGKPPCPATGVIPMDIVWGYLENQFVSYWGADTVSEGRYVKASPDAARLADLTEAWASVSEQAQRAKSQTVRKSLQARLDELDNAIATLEAQTAASGRWVVSESAETYAEAWARSDEGGRREMVIKAGVRLFMKREPGTRNYVLRWEQDTEEGVIAFG